MTLAQGVVGVVSFFVSFVLVIFSSSSLHSYSNIMLERSACPLFIVNSEISTFSILFHESIFCLDTLAVIGSDNQISLIMV